MVFLVCIGLAGDFLEELHELHRDLLGVFQLHRPQRGFGHRARLGLGRRRGAEELWSSIF